MGMIAIVLLAITLTWSDNSDNEDGFYIEKTISGDCINGFVMIKDVAANITTWVDELGVPGDCYRVRAFNSTTVSGYSNTAQIPYPPAPPPPPKKCRGKKC